MTEHRWAIETQRLRLREIESSDIDFVAEMLADPEVMRFYPKLYNRTEAQDWLDRQLKRYRDYGHGLWLVVRKDNEMPIGQIGVTIQQVDGVDETEVGYLLHRPFWGQGFAIEAARACRDYVFQSLRKTRVISLIRPINISSQRVAIRNGFLPERLTMRANLEHLVFSMSDLDWKKHVSAS